MGRALAFSLTPATEEGEVGRRCRETEEAHAWERILGGASFQGATDIRAFVQRAARGSVLTSEQLVAVADTLRAGRRVRRSLEQLQARRETPMLWDCASGIAEMRELESTIWESIDEDGKVLDGASPELAAIRRRQRSLSERIRTILDDMVRNPATQKYLQEPIVTVRAGRYCVPVRAEFKASFRGIVHDQSASGQTYFIEPAAIVSLGNELRAMQAAEEQEIERILKRLSALVGEAAEALLDMVERLGQLDFALAKARLAQAMRAEPPRFTDGGKLRLKRCRHPFIPEDRVVPIDLLLGDGYHVLIITGPNTGGKTVALKTAGLLVCMAQSGLFIPADPDSELSVFEQVFADIGDEQSIEQSLSTFSSHMKHIIGMLDRVHERTLVLLDEIGAGTDPAEGAAIAAAILEYLLERGARTIATTHYGDLKAFAFSKPGAMNASVEFDSETLRPTYRLLIGIPGRSNALAVAERLGLRKDILDRARRQLRTDDVRMEDMIRQLEMIRRQTESELTQARQARQEAERLREQWERATKEWEEQRVERTAKAEEEARRIVSRAEREVDAVLRELRRIAEENPSRVKEHHFTEMRKRLDAVRPAVQFGRVPAKGEAEDPGPLKAGDQVDVLSFRQKGTVLEVQGDQAMVQIGSLKTRVPVSQLRKLREQRSSSATAVTAVRKEVPAVGLELDLRGMTVEEAIPEIDKYLDRAVMAGLSTVHLIHGKGTGALRTGVQQYLQHHPHVRSFRNGGLREGGWGVTVVELK